MISFCVNKPLDSSTLYTSFADGGRCSIFDDTFTEISSVLLPLKAKTIPHGIIHHNLNTLNNS